MAQIPVPVAVQETDFTADRVNASNATSRPQNYGALNQVEPEPESAAPSAPSPPTFTRTARLLAPDLLRGLLMVLQSIDHASVAAGAWRHGQGLETEADSGPISFFNDNVPWTARTLTHLCAPGFTFLLGFGVVMFGQSRAKLGWSAYSMAWHFFVRSLVLTLACFVLGWGISGFRFWLLNAVLLALSVDYLLAGLFWMLLNASEKTLTRLLGAYMSPKMTSESEPLLPSESSNSTPDSRAATISFHLHNFLTAILSVVTIFWNIWMSPTHGHCQIADKSVSSLDSYKSPSGLGTWFDIWWYSISDMEHGIMSGFPPLAWISFALLGILYARIYTSRPWTTYAINTANAATAVLFAAIFVATRLLHIGNMSEGCLKTPAQIAHPDTNQYLASFKSFFYVVKYPPDVAFWAYTMSVNLFLLALLGAIPQKISTRIPGLLVFGKCALFFYVTHFVVFTVIATIDKAWFGKELGYTDPLRGGPAVGTGNVPLFWASWVVGICIMYPLCYYYGNFKATKSADSIWRFF